jgi:hypothetical protein
MPAFDVACRWKGRVVRARHGAGRPAVAPGGGRAVRLLRPSYTGASLVDLDEEDDAAAVAQLLGLPPR